MAIDTAAKRSSVQCYGSSIMRPPPDGTISEGDRAQLAWLYQGMDYNSPAAPAPTFQIRRLLMSFIPRSWAK